MNGSVRLIAIGMCLAATVTACATTGDAEFTTVVLVRHAEKAAASESAMLGTAAADPGLTDAGTQRALELAHVLGEAGVAAIYATQYARTRLTAQPLADSLDLEIQEVAAGRDEYVAEMVNAIRSQHHGDVVLVVSHSNTVPALIEALGAAPVPVIDDDEYDDLYVVTLGPGGRATLLPLRYGRSTP